MNEIKLNVQAIFDSIDGEVNAFDGAGQLATFIRLKGCNLHCGYCDTKYSQENKPENWMTIPEVLEKVHFPKVTITGGEPLLQMEAVYELCRFLALRGDVSIETNGSIVPIYFSRDIRYVMDCKTPSSGMHKQLNLEALRRMRDVDIIKFVIADRKDYVFAKEILDYHPSWDAKIVFSPVITYIYATLEQKLGCGRTLGHGEFCVQGHLCGECSQLGGQEPKINMEWPKQLVEMMIRDKVKVQFSLQLHKILWPGAKEER